MRRADDWQVPSQLIFNYSVEMIGMVVTEQDYVNGWKGLQVDVGVCFAGSSNAWAEMNMVSSVEEVGVSEEGEAVIM